MVLFNNISFYRKRCVLNDEAKIKFYVKSYLKSKKDNKHTKKRSSGEISSGSSSCTGLSGVTSLSQISNCSDLLSEIHTHKSQETINQVPEILTVKKTLTNPIQSPNENLEKVESLQKFADSMEVLSKKSRRIDFRKIFCCKPV